MKIKHAYEIYGVRQWSIYGYNMTIFVYNNVKENDWWADIVIIDDFSNILYHEETFNVDCRSDLFQVIRMHLDNIVRASKIINKLNLK